MVVRLVRMPEIEKKIRKAKLIADAEAKYGELSPLPQDALRFKRCLQCNRQYKIRINNKKKCKIEGFCSNVCRSKNYKKSKIIRKSILKIAPNFYLSREWREIRYSVLKKYNRSCMVCFRSNIKLHVDHIKPISKHPELALVFENLQVLCRDCNIGKGNKDSIDWR